MKLIADAGLWSTGGQLGPTPLVAVLEVSGAVLSWTVDDPAGVATIAFTDLARADWLWRIVGESGHSAVASALDGRAPDEAHTVELTDVGVQPGAVDPLRRLAVGHWLRRWWPASQRDGIAALDGALLDAELALLTARAQNFFTDDTFDSDVESLLRIHVAALNDHVRDGDPRVVELVRACGELAEDLGIAFDAVHEPAATGRRDDYALAAGSAGGRTSGAVATGTASINWSAVPPGIFDAAENTVEWRIEAGNPVKGVVRAELSGMGSAAGIAVHLRSGTVSGVGILDADGAATFQLADEHHRAITETIAWDHDWRTTVVSIGVELKESVESADIRQRIRTFARSRLNQPANDAYLAEILAAESDY
ncbi:hypothetical protein [Mycobacterium sp.]|uniref:hypothetical protein n=1 Tax=Mycobacterium sp. TaxID=1785 RepID=UPI002C513CE2|nr:hypothetical protein [Mycobacterium sp.]HKP41187.1 hypothetical protein [Mycobacterium sp.]